MKPNKTFIRILTTLLITLLFTSSVWSKPPPWAPAHGYRHKHEQKHDYHSYHEEHGKDLGIFDGRCIYEKAGTVIGGVIGGVLGSKVGDGDGKKIAIVAGTIIGAILGKRVGAHFDDKDRYCTGQTLEHAKNGQLVTWENPQTNVAYSVTPISSYRQGGTLCREFIIESASPTGQTSKKHKDACRDANQVWNTLY